MSAAEGIRSPQQREDETEPAASARDAGAVDNTFGTVVVCSGIVAIGIGTVYWLSRVGFSNPLTPVLRTIGLSLFLISAPYVARQLLTFRDAGWSWISSHSFLWLLSLVLTAVAGRIAGTGGIALSTALAVAGTVAFVHVAAGWIRRGSLRNAAAIMTGSALFALWTSGVVWGRIYKNPLFFENLAVNGMVHHDSLHLAAFANMLRTYGVASTGLDGLPYIPYHWGTAWLFAQWSSLLGISVLDFYQLAFPVMMIPLFFGGILAVVTELANIRNRLRTPAPAVPALQKFDIRGSPLSLAVLLIASVGVIPLSGLDALGVWTSNVVISESYTVAVPVALLLLAVTCAFWSMRGARGRDSLFLFAVLPLGIVALGYLKISLMVLAFLLAMYFGVRLRLYRDRAYLLAGGILLFVTILTYTQVSLPAHNEGLAPFDFLNGFVPRAWWPLFFLVHLLWSWIYILFRLWTARVRTAGELAAAVRHNHLLDAEAVGVVALAGLLPGLVMHIDGGSAFYFSDVQRWLAVAMLMAGALTMATRKRRNVPLLRLLVAVIAIPLGITLLHNAATWPLQMLRENAATRWALYSSAAPPPVSPRIRSLPRLADAARLQPALRGTGRYPALDQLRALAALPRAERRRTALFIPQSEGAYWGILARPGACTFSPFVAPALAGMAMVDGMPPLGCELSRYYGIGSYTRRTRMPTSADELPVTLCTKALRSGLHLVRVVRFDAVGKMNSAPIDCRDPRI